MVKPVSKTAARPQQKATPEQAEALAKQLADRPYGSEAPVSAPEPKQEKAKSFSMSLPPALYQRLEEQAYANKRSGVGPKTVSGIIREALAAAGYVEN